MKSINKLWVAIGLGYIFINTLSENDFKRIQNVLLTKIYQLEPKFLEIFNELTKITDANYSSQSKNSNQIIQKRIDKVQEELNDIKAEKMAALFLHEIKKEK